MVGWNWSFFRYPGLYRVFQVGKDITPAEFVGTEQST
jgi:hypothetical protein